MTTATRPVTDQQQRRSAVPLGWRRLLAGTSVAAIVAFLVVAALLRDPEAAAYAGGFAIGLALLRFRPRLGEVAFTLINLNVLVWMALGTISNVRGGQGFVAVTIPALLATLALVGLLAALGSLITRAATPTPSRLPIVVVRFAIAAFLAAVVAGVLTGGGQQPATAGELEVRADNLRFAPTALEAASGEVTVSLRNGDLFWHTFTIDELDVDIPAAVGAERRGTFDAPPGEYTYYCRIPGHEALMRGVLTVR